MAINLLTLEPHKIARDLSGYITYIYGEPKVLGLSWATIGDNVVKNWNPEMGIRAEVLV